MFHVLENERPEVTVSQSKAKRKRDAPAGKMLEVGWLAIWTLAKPLVSPRMLMVLLGRFTRCFEF